MADKINSSAVVEVSLPKAGEVAEYHLSSEVPVKLTFFVSEVVFSCNGNDLVFTGEHGGSAVIKDYLSSAREGNLPAFELRGGEEVPGDIYLFAFSDSESSIETAAGGHEAAGEVIPDEWLEPLMMPDEGERESSSMLDILTPGSLFSDVMPDASCDSGMPVSLFGEHSALVNFSTLPVSLADGFDPVDDAVQHIIDSPEYV